MLSTSCSGSDVLDRLHVAVTQDPVSNVKPVPQPRAPLPREALCDRSIR
jgi:hypothetical protein